MKRRKRKRKKFLTLLLAAMMILTLVACGGKTEFEPEEESPEIVTDPIEVEGNSAEYSMSYWEEKYPDSNVRPFTIDENGVERSCYWVSGLDGWDGTMASWINQPFNWDGWHYTADSCIVSK